MRQWYACSKTTESAVPWLCIEFIHELGDFYGGILPRGDEDGALFRSCDMLCQGIDPETRFVLSGDNLKASIAYKAGQ